MSDKLHTGLCVLGTAILLGGALVPGEALADVSEADYFAEMPVVLSPSRLSQPLTDSPSAVTVIDRDMIRASGFTHVADVFRLVPGFSVAYSSSLLPAVTYHGLGDGYARRFQVLVDGRSVYSPDFGQVSWRNLPLALDDIERIEVIRGPAGASYGANAFMGVINILTRSGDYGAPYVEAGLGDHGQRLLNARVGGTARAFNWRLSAGTQLDDGLRLDAPDDVRERFADWKSELQLDARQALTLQAGVAHTRQETDFTPYNQHHGYASLGWKFAQNADSEFFAAYNLTEESFGDESLGDLGYRTTRHNASAQWQGSVGSALRASLGAEYRRDSVQSDFYYSTPDTLTEDSWRVYGNGEWTLDPQWLVNFGGMVEHTHTGDKQFSPRLTLNYKPSRNQSYRLEYNRAYRAPTLYELFGQNELVFGPVVYQTLLAQNLQPEQVTSRALGWLLQLPKQGLQVDARLFYDRYENLIDVAFVSDGDGNDSIYQFVNRSEAVTLQGVEFQIEWRPAPSTRIYLTPAWARIHSHDNSIEDSAPPFSFSLLLDRKIDDRWRASAGYYHSGAMTWLAGGSRVPASDRLDARLAYHTRVNGKAVEFWLTGQSLLGGQTEFEQFQEAERRFLAGGRMEW